MSDVSNTLTTDNSQPKFDRLRERGTRLVRASWPWTIETEAHTSSVYTDELIEICGAAGSTCGCDVVMGRGVRQRFDDACRGRNGSSRRTGLRPLLDASSHLI
jgi:hypothetical protein